MKQFLLRLTQILPLLILAVLMIVPVHALSPVVSTPVTVDSSGLVMVDSYLSSQAGAPNSLAKDSKGNLIAFYTHNNVPWLSWSNDGGKTWSNNGGDNTVDAVQNNNGHKSGALVIDGSTIDVAYITTSCTGAPCTGVRVIRYTITYSGSAISSVGNAGVPTSFSIAGGPEACNHECVYSTTASGVTGAGDGNSNSLIAMRDIRISPNANEAIIHLHESGSNAYDYLFRVGTLADTVKAMNGAASSITKEVGSSIDEENSVFAIQPSTKAVWVFSHSSSGCHCSASYSYTFNSGTGNWARTANEAVFDLNTTPNGQGQPGTGGTANVAIDTVGNIIYWSWFTCGNTLNACVGPNRYEFAKIGAADTGPVALIFTSETTATPGGSSLVMSSNGNVNLFTVDNTGQMFYRSYNPTSTIWTTPASMSGYTGVQGSASLDTTSKNAISPIIFGVSGGNFKFGSVQFDPPANLCSTGTNGAIIGAGGLIVVMAILALKIAESMSAGTMGEEEGKILLRIILVVSIAILIVALIVGTPPAGGPC